MIDVDFDRAILDFPYYYSTFLGIRTKDRRYVPFGNWWPAQQIVWASVEADLRAGRPVRKIILKARQQGISTLMEALLFWQIHTVPNTSALVLSMDMDSASNIYEMSRAFYDGLPEAVRPMKRYSSKKELTFENPDERTRPANPGLRSRISVQTAGKFTPPRGAKYDCIHFSEVGFWPNASEIVPAIIPMVPSIPGSIIVYESTANGLNNFFHDEWKAAVSHTSAFDPIFIPWHVMPEYQLAVAPDERDEFAASMSPDEHDLLTSFNLTLEHIKWRRFKISEMKGDIDLFRQEFPATDDEAFMYSGEPIFSRKLLREIVLGDPKWRGDILISGDIQANTNGLLTIWERPADDAEYVFGIDTSSGVADDYSCMCVLKRTWPHGLCDQVAEWYGKIDPVALGHLAATLGRLYNNALLSFEINGSGLTSQVEAQRNYWNLYRWQYFDRLSKTHTDRVGWTTNVATKPPHD